MDECTLLRSHKSKVFLIAIVLIFISSIPCIMQVLRYILYKTTFKKRLFNVYGSQGWNVCFTTARLVCSIHFSHLDMFPWIAVHLLVLWNRAFRSWYRIYAQFKGALVVVNLLEVYHSNYIGGIQYFNIEHTDLGHRNIISISVYIRHCHTVQFQCYLQWAVSFASSFTLNWYCLIFFGFEQVVSSMGHNLWMVVVLGINCFNSELHYLQNSCYQRIVD